MQVHLVQVTKLTTPKPFILLQTEKLISIEPAVVMYHLLKQVILKTLAMKMLDVLAIKRVNIPLVILTAETISMP